jgi:hypothetical protein
MSDRIQTMIEYAVHSRWAAAWLYGKLPVSLSSECPCAWCKKRGGK